VLDAFTAVLFFLFAVLLWRSAPGTGEGLPQAETDGLGVAEETIARIDRDRSVLGVELPDRIGSFATIFALMAAGEFGDKTQLGTIGLAAQYGVTSAIWVGEMAAIIPVSLANAYFFHRFAGRVDVRKAHLGGAALFAFFGADTVLALVTGFSVWETLVGTVSEALLAVL